jgi:hypothetical protein
LRRSTACFLYGSPLSARLGNKQLLDYDLLRPSARTGSRLIPADAVLCSAYSGSLLRFPEEYVLTLHVKRAQSPGGIIVRLYIPSEQKQKAEVASALLLVDYDH